jgi:hypothetical protein
MACCVAKSNQPAEEKSAPAPQRAGPELAQAITAVPFRVLFVLPPVEAEHAPVALAAEGHSPEPLAVSCIQLI